MRRSRQPTATVAARPVARGVRARRFAGPPGPPQGKTRVGAPRRRFPAGRPRSVRLLLCLVLALLPHLPLLAGGALAQDAQLVGMRAEPEGACSRRELQQLREFPLPGPLDEPALERTRENFERTGRFASVRWSLEPVEKGTVVVFHLEPRPFVRRLEFPGRRQVERSRLLSGMTLALYDPLDEESLAAASEEAATIYEWAGFPRPGVLAGSRPIGPRGATLLTIEIDERPLPPVSEVSARWGGDPGWWNRRRLQILLVPRRWSTRRRGLNEEKWVRFLRREEDRFHQLGFLQADFRLDVAPAEGAAGDEAEARRLLLDLGVGPRVEIQVEGAGWRRQRAFKRQVRKEGLPMDRYRLERLSRRLAEDLAGRGFLEAQVAARLEEKEERTLALFEASPGPRHHVAEVRFQGNELLPERWLKKGFPLHPPRLLGLWRSRPTPENLAGGERALEEFYAHQGFPQAEVTAVLEPETGPGAEREEGARPRTVAVRVSEGPRHFFGAVSFTGVTVLKPSRLGRAVDFEEGDPYREDLVEETEQTVERRYRRKGYMEAAVTPGLKQVGEESLEVTFAVDEGPPFRMGPLIVSGNFKTRADVALRLAHLPRGAPFDERPVAELQQRLYDLDIFDSVAVHTLDGSPGPSPEKAVAVDVSERRTGFYETGLELNTEHGLEVTGAVGDTNLLGRALQMRLGGLLGTERRNVVLDAAQPDFLGQRLDNVQKVSYVVDETNKAFSSAVVSVEEGVVRRFNRRLRAGLTYRYEWRRLYDVDPEIRGKIDGMAGHSATLGPEVTWDHRNNPFSTTRGFFLSTRLGSARGFLGADQEFDRWEWDGRWFKPLGEKVVVGAALRGGRIWFDGGLKELSPDLRFFVGGADNHRGYGENDLGPHGKGGASLGGQAYLLASAEVRFPVWGLLDGGVFIDTGNNYLDAPAPPYLRTAAGAGLRLRTPFGPLRADAAVLIAPHPGEARYRIHLALGHAF